jgi:hypothetical protein
MFFNNLKSLDFQGWNGRWDLLWVALGAHFSSEDFLLFLAVALAVLTIGVQFIYYPLIYRVHRFRASSSIRLAWFLGAFTCLAIYLDMFWCFYSPLRHSYWGGLGLGLGLLGFLLWGALIPRRRVR